LSGGFGIQDRTMLFGVKQIEITNQGMQGVAGQLRQQTPRQSNSFQYRQCSQGFSS